MDQNTFASLVGNLLSEARLANGMTRKQVAKELPGEVSPRTIEDYESGRRAVTLLKFAQFCQVVRADATELLGRVIDELGVPDPTSILVDLRRVLHDDADDLTPLRKWAALMTSGQPYGSPVLWHFTPSAIAAMSALCEMAPRQLRKRLHRFETRLVIDGGPS